MRSNYHSHSTFCDGRSAPEDFLKFALSNKFRAYGFSSHSPLPFETFWNMSAVDLPEYLAECNRLKEKYGHLIEIYTSLEIDYLDQTYNPAIPYFQEMPLDYRLASVHFLPLSEELKEKNMVCVDGPYEEFAQSVEEHYNGEIRQMVEHYYRSVYAMLETGGFDIVGHLDKIYQNGHLYPGFSMDAHWYTEPLMACLELIARKGYRVEINTKNLTSKQQTFPHARYIPLLKELKIPVMVNSDCHYPQLVNDGRPEAFELLKAAGFTHTCELIKGKWEEVRING
ncbi:histidinol-phosphatase [Parabacteroides sp. PF5-6]|uniref:histidinol-phosphatase n=1 Tax=Parabacteroides sp. PF5-6 TaxID=1742403 RepID=UPI002406F0C1|nr:histidinol-phosphatase [Parabacteroides sp. PF5-6]MDF9829075.1 HisJ family histidinol phosphate phosphatase [Parabacteroides sp. PF5-6]